MKQLFSLTCLVLFALIARCQSQPAGKAAGTRESLTVTEFEKKLQALPQALLLDVRTPEEFAQGHLQNALNLDYNGSSFAQQLGQLDKSRPVLVYCLSGGRSSAAAAQLQQLGFPEVYELQGGIMKWTSANMPVTTAAAAPAPGTITKEEFVYLVKNKEKKAVLVEYHAAWCAPCKKLMPILERIEEDHRDKLVLHKIDADANKAFLKEKGIDAIPYLELYRDGKLVWKHSGYIEKADLLRELKL